MKKSVKWLLFISSYIPLFIILIFTNIDFKSTYNFIQYILTNRCEFILKNIKFQDIYLWILIILCITCLVLVKIVIIQSRGFEDNKKIIDIEPNNNSILEYFVTYLLTLSSSGFSFKEVFIFWFILYIIGHLYIKNNQFHINPTLCLLFKYNIYKVKTENSKECFILSKLMNMNLIVI
ncbi:hypothetical protein H477_3895 [[Clostridium] sordellii ATCC 9714]|nr:hypothetical protein H477_3895 [[Clostridium] sordellii ATCC 9714] [Paeniclostridium sordellii ATCC 9714]